MQETRFSARRSLKGARFLLGALGLVAGFGLLLLAQGEPLGWEVTMGGAALGAMVLLQTLRPWWFYAVRPDGIAVHRLFGTVVLARADVSSVKKVDGGRIEELLSPMQEDSPGAAPPVTFAQGVRVRRAVSRVVSFVTVPVVLTRTVQAAPLAVRRVAARAHGEFVLVSLRDGTSRALSPRDVTAFLRAWEGSQTQ